MPLSNLLLATSDGLPGTVLIATQIALAVAVVASRFPDPSHERRRRLAIGTTVVAYGVCGWIVEFGRSWFGLVPAGLPSAITASQLLTGFTSAVLTARALTPLICNRGVAAIVIGAMSGSVLSPLVAHWTAPAGWLHSHADIPSVLVVLGTLSVLSPLAARVMPRLQSRSQLGWVDMGLAAAAASLSHPVMASGGIAIAIALGGGLAWMARQTIPTAIGVGSLIGLVAATVLLPASPVDIAFAVVMTSIWVSAAALVVLLIEEDALDRTQPEPRPLHETNVEASVSTQPIGQSKHAAQTKLIEELRETNSDLASENASLRESAAAQTEQVTIAQVLEAKTVQLERTCEGLTNRLQEAEQQRQDAGRRVSSLEGKLASQEQQRSDDSQAIAELTADLESREVELDAMKTEHQAISEEWDAERTDLQRRLEDATEAAKGLTQTLVDERDCWESERAALVASVTGLRNDVVTLEKRLADQRPTENAAATQILCEQQKRQIERLTLDLAAAQSAAAEQGEHAAVVANLQADLEVERARVLELRRQVAGDGAFQAEASLPPESHERFVDGDALLTLCLNDVDLTCELLGQLQSELPTATAAVRRALALDDDSAVRQSLQQVRDFTSQLPLVPLGEAVEMTAVAVANDEREATEAAVETLACRIERTVDEAAALVRELRKA